MQRVALYAGLAALVTSACRGGGPPPFSELERDPSFPGSPADRAEYEHLFDFEPLETCRPPEVRSLALDSELRIFRGRGVGRKQMKRHLRGLQRYWAWFDVDFFTRHEVIDLPVSHLLTLDEDALTQYVMDETGLDPRDPGLTSEQLTRVSEVGMRGMFHNFFELLRTYGSPAAHAVNLVIVPRIADDEAAGERTIGTIIMGLGLSPELLEVTESYQLVDMLEQVGVPGEFTPFATIGADTGEYWFEHPDALIAHEVGHAYGLPHTEVAGNLMRQGYSPCGSTLSEQQTQRVSEWLETGARGHAKLDSLTHHMPELLQYPARLWGHL